jgi:hypothetical protein
LQQFRPARLHLPQGFSRTAAQGHIFLRLGEQFQQGGCANAELAQGAGGGLAGGEGLVGVC